jgi:peptidoglycan/LPS O-acetylase OafA/YrhL
MQYRTEIDGLRALAVLPVILFHAGFELFGGGFVGVDVFFVISGYLITTIILSELSNQNFSIINFYERRARRILPALFFVMLTCLPVAILWLTPSDLMTFGQSLIAVSSFTSNFLFWIETGYFDTASELKPLIHTWSLAVEEQYYILFPVFLMITWSLGIKKILYILIFIFLVSLSVAHWATSYAIHPKIISGAFFLLPTRGWELLLGVFAAFYLQYNNFSKSHLLNQSLSIIGFGLVIFSILFFDKSIPFPSLYALIPTIGTTLLILFATKDTFIKKFLSLKPFVGLGLISYSAYLWHQPLLAFARSRTFDDISNQALLFLCALSILMAYVSWRWVESPFRNKQRFSRRAIFNFSIAGVIFFMSFGFFAHFSNGLLSTYPPAQKQILANFFSPGEYVMQRSSEDNLKNFQEGKNKKKIIIIGDSFSQDIANAVYDSNLNKYYEISTYFIPNQCGILAVDYKEISKFVLYECANKYKFIENKPLQKLIIQADQVWLGSAWNEWTIPFIQKSIENLQKLNTNILVFGSKSFGIVKPHIFKFSPERDWSELIGGDFKKLKMINNQLQKEVTSSNAIFINTQELLCQGKIQCSNYQNGEIISYDGSHLTPYGAKLLGENLSKKLLLEL